MKEINHKITFFLIKISLKKYRTFKNQSENKKCMNYQVEIKIE
jgi:hypothetical protein